MREILKRDWKLILIQAVVSAAVLISAVWLLAWTLNTNQLEERIDTNTIQILKSTDEVKYILCTALAEAENRTLVRVLRETCKEVQDG